MRVLVVEPAQEQAGVLEERLRRVGHTVEVARDARLSLASLGFEAVYDLIVIDVAPPAPDALGTVRAVRARDARVPVLLLTGPDVAERIRGLDLGADDCLAKPFAIEELLARMRALLRRCPSERESVLRVADLTLDPATRTAGRGGRAIRLTTREFALLEYFMRNRGRVVTRDMIVDHVWDVGFEAESNVVEVYVGYVRRKIDAPGEWPLLLTLRGTGYMLGPGDRHERPSRPSLTEVRPPVRQIPSLAPGRILLQRRAGRRNRSAVDHCRRGG